MLEAHQVRRLLDGLAVDVDRIADVVAPDVPERVVKDGKQPCLEVRAGLELGRGAKRFEKRLLNQILRVGGPSREPQRGAVQAVHVCQCLTREPVVFFKDGGVVGRRLAAAEHHRNSRRPRPSPLAERLTASSGRSRQTPPGREGANSGQRENTGRERLYSGRLYSLHVNGDESRALLRTG